MSPVALFLADSSGGRNGFNPYGIAAVCAGVIVLIIVLIAFRKR
jgi:hypothetical protein